MKAGLLLLCMTAGCGIVSAQNSLDPTLPTPSRVRPINTAERFFQFSLFPGISTNGTASASYINKFSINVFGGYSAGNKILEFGLLTNSNRFNLTGLQFAGLANIVGANAYSNLTTSEERTLINSGFECSSHGIQVGGLLNYVRDNAKGAQVSAGLNVVGRSMEGVQVALLGNAAGDRMDGLQLSGLFNLAHESAAGFQFSSLFNYTDGQLTGVQLALVNKAGTIRGKNSTPPTPARGGQIGLVNFSRAMHGTQFGLVNFGGRLRGRQIGLINFFNKYPSKEYTRNGTPIGLLNFGSKGGYYRVYTSEIFPLNLERSTGNCLNCTATQSEMPYEDANKIYNQNALIFGVDPLRNTWGFGYGFTKVLYNKASMLPINPFNEKRMISYGIKFMHLNRDRSFDPSFNVLSRLNLDYGTRKFSGYLFVSVSLNYFLQSLESVEADYAVRSVVYSFPQGSDLRGSIWPGYSIGYQF